MVLVISGVVILPTSVSVAVTVGVVIAYVVEPELVGEVSACVVTSVLVAGLVEALVAFGTVCVVEVDLVTVSVGVVRSVT